MKKFILSYFLILPLMVRSQQLSLSFKEVLPDKVMTLFADAKLQQFYMTPKGDRLLLNSESGYFVYDLENRGTLLGEGAHVAKPNFVIQEASSGTVSLEEGVEYYVYEELNIALFLDWNLTNNIIKAVDLSNGKELFSLDQYRYTTSVNKQVLKAVASVVATEAAQGAVVKSGINAGTVGMTTLSSGITQSQYNSASFNSYAAPLDLAGRLLIKTEAGITCLDATSGKHLWSYENDLTIGYAGMPDAESVVLVHFKETELKKIRRLAVKLDAQTGKELWQAQPLSIFKQDRTYLVGDRLILDYYGAEVLDLNSGSQVLFSTSKASVKTANFMMKSPNASFDASLLFGDHVYTSTWKTFPNDGGGKADFQKYDINTGELVWETKKVADGISAAMVDERHLFLRKGKAFGQSSLFVLDTKTGAVLTETENIDGFVYRQGAGDILTDNYLYRNGKKSIYVFDRENWSVISEFDGKGADIGKLQATTKAGDNLLLIGDQGLAFFSPAGELLNTHRLPVVSATWNANKCFAFSENKTEVFSLKTTEKIQDFSESIADGNLFFISEQADKLGIISAGKSNEHYKQLFFYQE